MKVWEILRFAERLEDAMSRLYDGLRLRHAQDPEWVAFFTRLRDEELGHRDIVRYEQRVMFRSPDNYVDLPDYQSSEVELVLRGVEDLVELVPHLAMGEALRVSLEAELAATEQHYKSVVGRVNAELGALVRNLGVSDRDHIAQLEAFAIARGIAPGANAIQETSGHPDLRADYARAD